MNCNIRYRFQYEKKLREIKKGEKNVFKGGFKNFENGIKKGEEKNKNE